MAVDKAATWSPHSGQRTPLGAWDMLDGSTRAKEDNQSTRGGGEVKSILEKIMENLMQKNKTKQ